MVSQALTISIAYVLLTVIDPYILSWQCLNRPIVAGPLVGLLLGDVKTGIILGASLESIFMGISAIGGSIPSDPTAATFITVAFAILMGDDTEAGLALAMPIGTLMISFSSIFTPLWGSLAPYWEKIAAEAKPKKLLGQSVVITILQISVSAIVMFFAIAYGTEGLSSLMNVLPAWVMTGLGAASSMMIGVGIAILTSMIWDGKVGVFFFLGYVLAKALSLSTLMIAVIGITIAVTIFFQNKEVIDLKNSLGKKSQSSDEKGFFA